MLRRQQAVPSVLAEMFGVNSPRIQTGGCRLSSRLDYKPFLNRPAWGSPRRRQVQDLERQLSHTRQQLYHLRSRTQVGGSTDSAIDLFSPIGGRGSSIASQRGRRQILSSTHDFTQLRRNLQLYGNGIIDRLRSPSRGTSSAPHHTPLPTLPPRSVAGELLRLYHRSVHAVYPVLDWPVFQQTYESVYEHNTLQVVPPIWSALLFSVFACGSTFLAKGLDETITDGKRFLNVSRALVDPWEEDYSIDHVRVALLSSMFLFECNSKSAAWTYLGAAVRISQNINLHLEPISLAGYEVEVRKRVWWVVYAWDR